MTTVNTQFAQAAINTTVEAVKLTYRERLVAQYNKKHEQATALNADLIKLTVEINSIDALAALVAGNAVLVNVGKGDEAKDVPGIVVAVRDEDDGSKTYKVQYGSGFDATLAIVKSNKLTLITAEAPVAEATATEPEVVA